MKLVMFKLQNPKIFFLLFSFFLVIHSFGQEPKLRKSDLRLMLDFDKTKDPSTGEIPKEKLVSAHYKAKVFKKDKKGIGPTSTINFSGTLAATVSLSWSERGPFTDATGPSNGNTRANSASTAGRVRAIWPDLADATGKTVWAAGVDGGLWKSTDITLSPANWVAVDDDQFNNLAITSMTQDPINTNVLYASTGESFMSYAGGAPTANAVKGVGVYKSINNGVNWTLIPSTTTAEFPYITKILCGPNGYIYLATKRTVNSITSTTQYGSLRRSTDGGTTWTIITPDATIMPNNGNVFGISDIEMSSTGRLHVTCGIFGSAQYYAYTDNPGTVSSTIGTGWISAVSPFPNYTTSTDYRHRTELAVNGNTLYALPVKASTLNADVIYKSTDGGANWAPTTGQIPTATPLTNGQAYYDLAIAINPANANECIVGGLDNWKTTDGGATWTKISAWVGTVGQYVHADMHNLTWYNNGNSLLFGSDGGVFYSADKGVTIRDRNNGLRIKQFYSTAIHPTATNYFLAGAQDNGTHQLNAAGLASSIEVLGGDGGFVAIDQTDPSFQFGTYVYGAFRRSINGGSSWDRVEFYEGTSTAASQMGQFINAYALDDSSETIYAGASAGSFFRWTTATTTPANNYFMGGTPPIGAAIISGVTNFGGGQVSAVKISPYTLNRVFFGTTNGKIVRIDNANTAVNNPTTVNITPSAMSAVAAYTSSINIGTTDNNIIACYSNYGVSSIWVSSDAGVNWTTIDGDLADMPVRWAMFYPGDDTKAIIATETGVWMTDLINGATTAWTTNSTFPTVRTDMLAYRKLDGTLVAATHGRGLFSTTLPSLTCTPAASTIVPAAASVCSGTGTTLSLNQVYNTAEYTFQWMTSTTSGGTFTNLSTTATQATGTLIANTFYKCTITCITTGNSFTTPEMSVSVTTAPADPSVTPGSRCGTGTVALSATPPAGATIAWFSTATLGTALATTNAFTTPSITVSTTYYAESRIGTTCVSATRTPVLATVNAVPAVPTAGTAGSRCGTGSVIINATTPNGITVDWYAAATLGTVLANGTGVNSFTTPSITATTNYFAQARNTSGGCISATRLSVAATVSAAPAAATAPVNATRCGSGTVTLSATAAAGTTVDWYNASTAGTRVQAGTLTGVNNYVPTVSATTIFYAETRNLTGGCVSATRAAVTATVTTAPAAPSVTPGSRCGTGTVALSATPPAGATIAWFAAATGGTALATTNAFTTPSITASTTYHVESRIGTTCISATRTAVIATVNAVPAVPTAGLAGSRCGTGSVVINATTPAGITVDWYAAATLGTVLANGTGVNSFTTPSITATTNYFAQARNTSGGCISATRLSVAATVSAAPTAATAPVNATRCATGTVTLSATAATGTTVDWYDASTAGTRLKVGTLTGVNTYVPTVSATTIFYAGTRNLTTGCVSATRVAVTAFVGPPAAPSVTPGSRCGTGTVALSATPPAGATIAWFSTATLGTALATTNAFTTPSITVSTTYYAESRFGTTCVSATRTPVLATVNAVSLVPTAGLAGSRCGTGSVIINATTPAGTTVDWYAAATGGTVLANGTGVNSFNTPSITATTNYFAQARNSTTGCISATRLSVAATVNAIPAAPASIAVVGGTSSAGTLTICPVLNTNYTYTAAAVTGISIFNWTIPICATPSTTPISTTRTLIAKFNGAGTTDSIKVQSKSTAGCLSVVRKVRVTSLSTCPACTVPVVESINSAVSKGTLKTKTVEPMVVNVFPNPTAGSFNLNVKSSSTELIQVRILDAQGRLINKLTTTPSKTTLLGSNLLAGVYYFEIKQGNEVKQVKVVKF